MKGAQDTTTKQGQLTKAAANRAKGMANSVEANERHRHRREPPTAHLAAPRVLSKSP
ncbi:MAG: hypothetical protein ACLP3C_03395 [Mycobacterium sp.]|uniref:hypothetical protein n=1 Tax=Mycobacterium sp. TaxID=1785 RepID=UPI003C34C7F2